MLRHRHAEFSKSELLLPIFERARNTLFELMGELLLSGKVQKIRVKYQLPTLENTFRFLFKSKNLFLARSRVVEILKLLVRRKVRRRMTKGNKLGAERETEEGERDTPGRREGGRAVRADQVPQEPTSHSDSTGA